MENELKIGGIYRHFKGNDKLYKIEKIDEKKVEMQMMSLGSKPKEFYNYH